MIFRETPNPTIPLPDEPTQPIPNPGPDMPTPTFPNPVPDPDAEPSLPGAPIPLA